MATVEQMINADMDQREQLALHRAYAAFMDKWAPDEERGEFDADLMMLVHHIHREAAKPYLAIVERMMNLIPITLPKGER